jgi:hypothetical protein
MFRRADETVGGFWQRKVLLTVRVMGMCCYLGVLGFAVYKPGAPVSELYWFFWVFVVGMMLSALFDPGMGEGSFLGRSRVWALGSVVLGLLVMIASVGTTLFAPLTAFNLFMLGVGLRMWVSGVKALAELRRGDEVGVG